MVRLTVYGEPRSHTAGRRRDGSAFVRSPGREEQWVEAVARQAMWRRSQGGELPEPPYAVELAFYLPWAKRPAHPWPTRLDLDKLVRAVLDGLVRGGLLVDDRHVVELAAVKRRATSPGGEGVMVTITYAGAAESGSGRSYGVEGASCR